MIIITTIIMYTCTYVYIYIYIYIHWWSRRYNSGFDADGREQEHKLPLEALVA